MVLGYQFLNLTILCSHAFFNSLFSVFFLTLPFCMSFTASFSLIIFLYFTFFRAVTLSQSIFNLSSISTPLPVSVHLKICSLSIPEPLTNFPPSHNLYPTLKNSLFFSVSLLLSLSISKSLPLCHTSLPFSSSLRLSITFSFALNLSPLFPTPNLALTISHRFSLSMSFCSFLLLSLSS